MWFTILAVMSSVSFAYFYTDKFYSVGRKVSLLSSLLFKHAVYNLADQYGLVAGEKKIAENLNMARVSYRNLRGDVCYLHVPFIKENVRVMKDKVVLLEKETKNGMVHVNITQEPGMPYLLSPFELGGRAIKVYPCSTGWNTKDFLIQGEPIMVVKKNEKIPSKFEFKQDEPEVAF